MANNLNKLGPIINEQPLNQNFANNCGYGVSSNGTDDYAINLIYALAQYIEGQMFRFKADVANTGACTLNINTLGAKAIKMEDGSDPTDGMIQAGAIVTVVYDGTNFMIPNSGLMSHVADFMPHGVNNAGFHNSIYRGKDLGTSVTAEQYNNIANGTFKDMYIGDYWTINGTKYLVAAFNYYYNAGDTALTQNHVTLVPESTMYNHVMNDTNTTDGGYVGSKMYTEGLNQAKATIATDFSGHVVNHRKYLCNAVTDGEASAGAWLDSEVELMNEMMVYGSVVNGHATYGMYNVGVEKTQLPLFALRPDIANIRTAYWLQDVSSASNFALVSTNGHANRANASYSPGVRPAFSIS